MIWRLLEGHDPEELGFIPQFLSEHDPRPAREQFDERYAYGGYWLSKGLVIDKHGTLHHKGDPPLKPIAAARLRDEMILVYPGAFVAIIQKDGSFVLQRMD